MSRPLGSAAAPASSSFTATTGRSASERRDRYSMPSVAASARSLSRPNRPQSEPWRLLSTLAFSRSVQEPQTGLTPPLRRAPPGQEQLGDPPDSSREQQQNPRFRCHLDLCNDASTAHAQPPAGRFWNVFPVPT